MTEKSGKGSWNVFFQTVESVGEGLFSFVDRAIHRRGKRPPEQNPTNPPQPPEKNPKNP